jgi:integrase
MTSLPLAAKTRAKHVGDAFRLLLERTARRVAGGTRSGGTLSMQRKHVGYFLERLPSRTPVGSLTPARIARLLEQERAGRRGRVLSGGTLRKRASTLSQALELATGRPPRLPEIPHRYVPRREFIETWDDYERIRDALEPRRRLWFVVAVWTGQRAGDVERMVKEDFDPRVPSIVVRSTKTRRGRVQIHAGGELVRELGPHWEQLPAGAKLVDAWPHVSSQLIRLSERLGVARVSAHRLRHTFFTWFVAANGFTPEMLAIGGWTSLQIPSAVYAHALRSQFRGQIDRTVAFAASLRRPPQKISARGLSSKRKGPAGATNTGEPTPSLVGTYETGRDHKSPRSVKPPVKRPVSAEGIEPSTKGLRVLLSLASGPARGDLPMEGPPCPQQQPAQQQT